MSVGEAESDRNTEIFVFAKIIRYFCTFLIKACGILDCMETEQNIPKETFFHRAVFCLTVFFLLLALSLFILTYGVNEGTSTRPFEFYRTFFIFFALYSLCVLLLFSSDQLLGSFLLCFLALTALLVIDYSLNDFLTIRLALFLALQTVLLEKIHWPFSPYFGFLLPFAFAVLQQLPPFLGENDMNLALQGIRREQLVSFTSLLLCFALLQISLTRYHELYEKAKAQIAILNTTITKLTVFSQSLQSYARTAELEAAKKERYRISREIHDISGYMFTNIIAMMDAIVSTGCRSSEKTTEMCSAARSQAQEGLLETRRALHLLRSSDNEREVGMKAIHKIKKIFEGTTGVRVDIETGNLPSSFGDELDLILYRIVQEGLTNALRHGHANRVRMLFWIVSESVQVIILDNGSGSKKVIKGIGLAGMEERISRLGGTVRAENAPEGGFQLTVTIPLQKEQYSDTNSLG